MDNITHSLAGMVLAEAACVARRETRQEVRAAAYLVSALANNLPDIDVVYSSLLGPKPLGSLLHHRGHTHTLLVALPGAWLLGVLLWRWFSKRSPVAADAPARQLIFGLALVGPLVHLLMDFGNNYGVHPFWPLSARWFYGDSIFIVEPLWWVVAIPILGKTLHRRWLKLLLWSLLFALLLVCWFVPFVLPASRVVLLGLCAASFAVAHYASERARAGYAVAGSLAVAGAFVCASLLAKAQLKSATVAAFPALTVLDLAMTPMPANPTCWEGLVAGEQGGVYRVLRASVALPPLSSASCAAGDDVTPTAPVQKLDRPLHGGVHFQSEYRAEVAELRRLERDDCRFRALLEFARLPYVTPAAPGERGAPGVRYAGDLRYDRSPDLDFSDLSLPLQPQTGVCPRFVPGWREPRAELFRP